MVIVFTYFYLHLPSLHRCYASFASQLNLPLRLMQIPSLPLSLYLPLSLLLDLTLTLTFNLVRALH